MVDTYYVERARIPWYPASADWPRPCGRNIKHDSRNRAYPHQQSGRSLANQLWPRHIGILDQGRVGSCTGEEEVGVLGTGWLWNALSAAQRATLGQPLALKFYSEGETIDGDGPYPPNDNGSSGPSTGQAAKNDGYISGYTHCFALADVLDALQSGPVGIGSNWYDSMDSPDSSGLVAISSGASVRGGHEYVCRGIDVANQLVHCDNSWGTGFGVNGSFTMSWDTLTRLLAEQGDGTVSLPLSVPAPIPVPNPPVPVPVPVPVPPGPDANPDDVALAAVTHTWAFQHHTGSNHRAAKATQAWLKVKGFV